MFIFTRHALQKIDALGLEKRDAEQAIKEGMKWKEKDSDKWHAQMAGIEVVFVKQEKDMIIITVYLAGRLK